MEPSDQLASVIPLLIEIVDGLEPDQLASTTPCANFDVAGVLGHMMSVASAYTPVFLGHAVPEASTPPTPLGQVPAAEFRSALTQLLDSVSAPGAMDRMVDAPFGRVPGSVFARFVAFDGLIHGWDLATAVGSPYEPSPEVVVDITDFIHDALGEDMRDGDTFAAATVCPAGAGPLEQLVAFSGRSL